MAQVVIFGPQTPKFMGILPLRVNNLHGCLVMCHYIVNITKFQLFKKLIIKSKFVNNKTPLAQFSYILRIDFWLATNCLKPATVTKFAKC